MPILRKKLISKFKKIMKISNFRQCLNFLLVNKSNYNEQIKCQTLYDTYWENIRIKENTK